jgi:hypothetical protein
MGESDLLVSPVFMRVFRTPSFVTMRLRAG